MAVRRTINPYIAGNPIRTRDMFFGREDVFQYVRQHLVGRYQDNIIVLHGQKRTGKTSVLYQIMNRGLLGDQYTPVYIDLQGLIQPGLAGFLHDIAREICLKLDIPEPGREFFETDPGGYFRTVFLKDTLDQLGGKHLLLMIDEYEVLERRVQEGSLSAKIFPFLRHLMQHFDPLSFLFTGCQKLEELDPQYWGIMHNALYKKISFLDQDSAWRLVTQPAQGIMQYDPSAVARILLSTSGHPYFVQLTCQEIFNARQGDLVTEEDVDSILGNLADSAASYLGEIWRESSDSERAILATIAASVEGPEPVTAHRIAEALGQDSAPATETQLYKDLDGLLLRDILILEGQRRYRMAVDLLRIWINETQDFNRVVWEYTEKDRRERDAEISAPAVPSVPARKAETLYLNVGQMYPRARRIAIGRHPSNLVVLNHPSVSRYHAVIERFGQRFRLRDLQSTHGTFVNGRRVRETWLRDGDTLQFAMLQAIFQTGRVAEPGQTGGIRLDAMNLEKWYTKSTRVLDEISLSIYPGEFVAIVGASGSGKTTLINALSGFNPANGPRSRVLVNGQDLSAHMDDHRDEIGYVPQEDIIHREMTVEKALDFAAQLRMPSDTSREARHRQVREVITELGLERFSGSLIASLSGAARKLVSIGVELITTPHLFFLDEATAGLDPATEAEMMKLLRGLADGGRTVVLVTHATKNVMLCDQVIFLTKEGCLAFYGPPDEALDYFEDYRTPEERRYASQLEFDSIYQLLERRGTSQEWAQRFHHSPQYGKYIVGRLESLKEQEWPDQPSSPLKERRKHRVSAFRQFWILSARSLWIIAQDKIGLALMLIVAPIIGFMDFIWGKDLFDLQVGDATQIITMYFMMGLICMLVGVLSSVREIVKENDVYRRERTVVLKLMPYISSKVWVGVILALYQTTIFVLAKKIFVDPEFAGNYGYSAMYLTVFLCTLSGYMLGLLISAAAPNQNVALLLVVVALVPQFLFAGALLPRDLIPGGEAIGALSPTRWAFEALVRISGIGDDVVNDRCWQLPRDQRDYLTLDDKVAMGCRCMGEQMFEQCYFPGIRSLELYNEEARAALEAPEPIKPSTPTPHPTFTPYPTLTPLPTPGISGDQQAYEQRRESQGQAYEQIREQQGEDYRVLVMQQYDQYQNESESYGESLSTWQSDRESAIRGPEELIAGIYTNYGPVLRARVDTSWLALALISVVVLGLTLLFQKRKDVV
jgi:ABC-type multidrug transport system ATPase subunit